MGNSWFQFQQFRVYQDRCAMKISTDAVLLGSLAAAAAPNRILDIGTGTGVIALMLAQRFPDAQITAVETDEDAAAQAGENFTDSPFTHRLTLVPCRIQYFSSETKFDLIVSNPPFFPDHLKSKDSKRNRALHTDELSFEELVAKTTQLLSASGTFWVILPPRQMQELELICEKAGLYLNRRIRVRDSIQKPVYREIAAFSTKKSVTPESKIVLKDENMAYTEAYSSLLSGFLLGY
jgi:tRNA1Val (adenine37-N6)-methyltransferase